MKEITVTPRVLDKIKERGGVKGYVPVIDIEGPNTAVVKLTPWWNDPVVRFRNPADNPQPDVVPGHPEIGWNPSYEPNKEYPAPASAVQAIEARTPPVTRTTAQQKYEVIHRMLTLEARKFTVNGVTTWPASVQKELNEAAWKMGKAGQLTTEEQVELLARTYIVTSAHKQKEHDEKNPNSVHPSRGHYAA